MLKEEKEEGRKKENMARGGRRRRKEQNGKEKEKRGNEAGDREINRLNHHNDITFNLVKFLSHAHFVFT